MEVFNLTLNQMLVMFIIMLTGYILKKGKFIPDASSAVISKMLAFVISPALTLYNQIVMCTPETFTQNSRLILYGLIIVVVAILIILCLLSLSETKIKNPTLNISVRFSNMPLPLVISAIWEITSYWVSGATKCSLNTVCSPF